jgi:septum formation protein
MCFCAGSKHQAQHVAPSTGSPGRRGAFRAGSECIIEFVRLILASASPRRADLLAAAGFAFDVMPVEIDERVLPAERPADYVARLARQKSREVGRRNSGRPVLGADTSVVVDDRILGKPADGDDATEMLRMLSGRGHDVLTGVAVCLDGREACDVVCTRVRFLQLSDAEIAWYVASGEPFDKAGAYAVQGLASRFVVSIDGSYSNVVGLPVATVYRLLKQLGVPS